jgi:putative colanic acid biosynthesis UDP-glucose lipid carrier transferase
MKNVQAQLVILLAFLLAYYLRFDSLTLPTAYIVVLLLGLLIAGVVLPATGAFRREFRWAFMRKTRRLIAGWALVVMILVTIAAVIKTTAHYSRIWFAYWVLFGALGLVVSQLVDMGWRIHRRRQSKNARRLVLIGGGGNGQRVKQHILSAPDGDVCLLACFGEPDLDAEVHPLGELAEFVEREKVGEVWIAVSWEGKDLLERSLEALNESVVDVNIIPDLHQYRLLNQGVVEWDGLPVINLSGTPMTGAERRIKAGLDRLGAGVLLVTLSPLLLLIAAAVKVSGRGPVLFRQTRHGMGGEIIRIFKFRSMQVQAEAAGEFKQARPDDSRVTAIGKFLRKTSLDELPQLINVLRGEMSLVGPRPHPIELNGVFMSRIPKFMLRHKVKPGMTGWAQVNGHRGLTDTEEKMALRIEHDLWYIQNWSLWLDIKILLQTPLAMIHRNAF